MREIICRSCAYSRLVGKAAILRYCTLFKKSSEKVEIWEARKAGKCGVVGYPCVEEYAGSNH